MVWPVYLLAALGAAASAFDGPARQALIPNLVPREHLANALSLNQIMFQSASVLGPSIGGVLIASLGVGWAYLFNAVSFLFVLVALVLMRDVPVIDASERAAASFGAAREGLRFVFSSPIIRATMLLDFAATFFASATALLPIFAQDILHVGANGYGWLYAAPSVGSLLAGAIMIRAVDRIERRGVVLLCAITVYGLATVAFGLSRAFWLSFFCLAMTGAADAVSTVLRSIIRQLMTPDRLRGRVTSVNMIFFMGGPQLGELEAGLVANWKGAPFSVITGGIGTLIATDRRCRGRARAASLSAKRRGAARRSEQRAGGRGERLSWSRARGNGELIEGHPRCRRLSTAAGARCGLPRGVIHGLSRQSQRTRRHAFRFLLLDVHVRVVAGNFPEHAVARLPQHRRESVRIRRMEIERQAEIVGGPPAVNMVVCRDEPNLVTGS